MVSRVSSEIIEALRCSPGIAVGELIDAVVSTSSELSCIEDLTGCSSNQVSDAPFLHSDECLATALVLCCRESSYAQKSGSFVKGYLYTTIALEICEALQLPRSKAIAGGILSAWLGNSDAFRQLLFQPYREAVKRFQYVEHDGYALQQKIQGLKDNLSAIEETVGSSAELDLYRKLGEDSQVFSSICESPKPCDSAGLEQFKQDVMNLAGSSQRDKVAHATATEFIEANAIEIIRMLRNGEVKREKEKELLDWMRRSNPLMYPALGLTASTIAESVEPYPMIAVECISQIIARGKHLAGIYLAALVATKVSMRSLDVVNRLLTKLSELGAEGGAFLREYISHCMLSCEKASTEYQQQQRLVRLVCVFLRSVLLQTRKETASTIQNALRHQWLEIERFCIQFNSRDSTALYSLLKQVNQTP